MFLQRQAWVSMCSVQGGLFPLDEPWESVPGRKTPPGLDRLSPQAWDPEQVPPALQWPARFRRFILKDPAGADPRGAALSAVSPSAAPPLNSGWQPLHLAPDCRNLIVGFLYSAKGTILNFKALAPRPRCRTVQAVALYFMSPPLGSQAREDDGILGAGHWHQHFFAAESLPDRLKYGMEHGLRHLHPHPVDPHPPQQRLTVLSRVPGPRANISRTAGCFLVLSPAREAPPRICCFRAPPSSDPARLAGGAAGLQFSVCWWHHSAWRPQRALIFYASQAQRSP